VYQRLLKAREENLEVEQQIVAREVTVSDALLVTVVNTVEDLTEPDPSLFLRDSLQFLNVTQHAATGRFFHHDVHSRVCFDRLQRP